MKSAYLGITLIYSRKIDYYVGEYNQKNNSEMAYESFKSFHGEENFNFFSSSPGSIKWLTTDTFPKLLYNKSSYINTLKYIEQVKENVILYSIVSLLMRWSRPWGKFNA